MTTELKNQIEALLFRRKKGEEKIIAERIEVDQRGLTVETIDQTIDELENRTETIYYKLFQAENEWSTLSKKYEIW